MKTYTASSAVKDEQDVLDLIAEAHYNHDAQWVLVPVELLPAEFFQLRSGLAGAIVQKFVQYEMKAMFVGDITGQVEASTAFRDWVRETNRGRHLRFEPDEDAALGWLHGRGSDSASA